jgi:hypothetical protein
MVRILEEILNSLELRYLASREWMESEILSGRPVQRRDQQLRINLDEVDPELRARSEGVMDAVVQVKVKKKLRMCVLDSGIDPELGFGPDKNHLTPMDTPIVEAIGPLPELPEPSKDLAAVVESWEAWLAKYKEEALGLFQKLVDEPPTLLTGLNPFVSEEEWDPVEVTLGESLLTTISSADGAAALQSARAGHLWDWAATKEFSSESYEAADEATEASPLEGKRWIENSDGSLVADLFLKQQKQLFLAAKAHDKARSQQVSDFDDEMKRWAKEHGSKRLQLGIEDGYRMHSRYLAERLAAEAPGMFAMPAKAAEEDWAYKASSPSESALQLRRKVEAAMTSTAPANLDGQPQAEIVVIKKPPHGMYLADPGFKGSSGKIGAGLPSRMGWPWRLVGGRPANYGAKPFEAVVVKHWLGRYHLIGAVPDGTGGPPGIWAIPDPDCYEVDGRVHPQDPDAPEPNAARRKPPDPPKSEDDIPF